MASLWHPQLTSPNSSTLCDQYSTSRNLKTKKANRTGWCPLYPHSFLSAVSKVHTKYRCQDRKLAFKEISAQSLLVRRSRGTNSTMNSQCPVYMYRYKIIISTLCSRNNSRICNWRRTHEAEYSIGIRNLFAVWQGGPKLLLEIRLKNLCCSIMVLHVTVICESWDMDCKFVEYWE